MKNTSYSVVSKVGSQRQRKQGRHFALPERGKIVKGLDREWLEGLCKLLLIYWAQKDQPSETSISLLDGSLGPGTTYLESSLGEWWGWLDNCRNLWWNSGILSMGWDGGPLLAHLWLHCFSLSVKLCNWIECSFECKRIWSPTSIRIYEILWILKKVF